jgi:hypothetical protein
MLDMAPLRFAQGDRRVPVSWVVAAAVCGTWDGRDADPKATAESVLPTLTAFAESAIPKVRRAER